MTQDSGHWIFSSFCNGVILRTIPQGGSGEFRGGATRTKKRNKVKVVKKRTELIIILLLLLLVVLVYAQTNHTKMQNHKKKLLNKENILFSEQTLNLTTKTLSELPDTMLF